MQGGTLAHMAESCAPVAAVAMPAAVLHDYVQGCVSRARASCFMCAASRDHNAAHSPLDALGALLRHQLVHRQAQLQVLGAQHVGHHRLQHLRPPRRQLATHEAHAMSMHGTHCAASSGHVAARKHTHKFVAV